MDLVVLLDLVVVYSDLFAEDCTALGHEMLGDYLGLLYDLALLHLFLCSACTEDLVELVFLFDLKLLFLLLAFR